LLFWFKQSFRSLKQFHAFFSQSLLWQMFEHVCVSNITHISANLYCYLTIFWGISPFCIPRSHPLAIKTNANNCLGQSPCFMWYLSLKRCSVICGNLENRKSLPIPFPPILFFCACNHAFQPAKLFLPMFRLCSLVTYRPHLRHMSPASHSQQASMALHWSLAAIRHAHHPSLTNSSCRHRPDGIEMVRRLPKTVE